MARWHASFGSILCDACVTPWQSVSFVARLFAQDEFVKGRCRKRPQVVASTVEDQFELWPLLGAELGMVLDNTPKSPRSFDWWCKRMVGRLRADMNRKDLDTWLHHSARRSAGICNLSHPSADFTRARLSQYLAVSCRKHADGRQVCSLREQAEHRQVIAVGGAQIGSARLAVVVTATTGGWPMLDVFALTRSDVAVYPFTKLTRAGTKGFTK